ncbi:unnamed protein product [Chilo suppressalis]|uniref:FLYWCH-type domain-containing protein n=1 Tax=Chilo suppressalis TaxID=168631 RepID=A0ABN8AV62_CHISP|nr:unnamed protein product [Chilo suppressalis]
MYVHLQYLKRLFTVYNYSISPIFTTTIHGNPVMHLGNHRFNKYHRSKEPRTRWVCTKKKSGCKIGIITDNGVIIKVTNQHNHY